jgi:hypothetical protein
MPNYLFAYTGGSQPQSEEEGKKVMAAWVAWLGGLGDAAVDPGNPFSGGKTVASDGATKDGAAGSLSGYSVVKADDFAAALKLAEGCPQLDAGGGIEVYETLEIM